MPAEIRNTDGLVDCSAAIGHQIVRYPTQHFHAVGRSFGITLITG